MNKQDERNGWAIVFILLLILTLAVILTGCEKQEVDPECLCVDQYRKVAWNKAKEKDFSYLYNRPVEKEECLTDTNGWVTYNYEETETHQYWDQRKVECK